MKNLKIGKKLYITFGITIGMLLLLAVMCIFGLSYSGNQFKDYYSYSYPMANTTLDVRRGVQTAIKAISISMLTDDQDTTQSYIAEAETEMMNVDSDLDYLMDNYRGEKTRIQETIKLLEEATESRKQIQDMSKANRNTEAAQLFFNEFSPKMIEIRDLAQLMQENCKNLADDTYLKAAAAQNAVTILSIVLSAVVIILTLALATYLIKSLTKPIKEIETAAKDMANGSLGVNITYESKDELGCLATSMNSLCGGVQEIIVDIGHILAGLADGDFHITSKCLNTYIGDYVPILTAMRLIRDNLNATMTQISQASDQVASGASQMAIGAQTLAEGATEQAGAVEELTATVENVSTIAQESADAADAAYQKAWDAADRANSSKEDLHTLTSAMERISNTSKEIENIITSIEEIATQTNLLSLNASIEAARAGEAGKGFAVVADQIGKLASDSAQSAIDTRELIAKSLKEIETGNSITFKTVEAIGGILTDMKDFAVNAKGSSEASYNQAEMLKQVEQGIEQISAVVQSNSAAAEETSATSEELYAQSASLKEQIDKFKLLEV